MYSFKSRLAKFKQELFPILFASVFQVWWSLSFPAYPTLVTPWNTIVAVGLSIVGVIACIYLFSFADTFASRLKIKFLDSPAGYFAKWLRRSIMLIVMLIGAFIVWYNDLYHLPDTSHYVVLYAFYFIFFVLLARAIRRKPATA